MASVAESPMAQRRSTTKPLGGVFSDLVQATAASAGVVGDQMTPLTVILFGATGDLAKKKLYPALYQLMFGCPDAPLYPRTTRVVGYGRGEQELSAFLDKQCVNVKGEHREAFLKQCSYFAGAYDKEESFAELHEFLRQLE